MRELDEKKLLNGDVIDEMCIRDRYHKSFSNHVSVDLICLSFANVIFSHLTGFDGVQHTHLVKLSNEVSNKVVTVVCR